MVLQDGQHVRLGAERLGVLDDLGNRGLEDLVPLVPELPEDGAKALGLDFKKSLPKGCVRFREDGGEDLRLADRVLDLTPLAI